MIQNFKCAGEYSPAYLNFDQVKNNNSINNLDSYKKWKKLSQNQRNIYINEAKKYYKGFLLFYNDKLKTNNNINKSYIKEKWNKLTPVERAKYIEDAKKKQYNELLNIKKNKNITRNYKDLLPKYTSIDNNKTKKNNNKDNKDTDEILKQLFDKLK